MPKPENEIKARWGDSINLLYCSHITNKSRRSYRCRRIPFEINLSSTNPLRYKMFCEKTLSDRKSLWRKTCAKEMVPGQVPPVQPGPSTGIPTKKTPQKSGSDRETSSNDSEAPSHIIPPMSVAFCKENLILIEQCSPFNSACDGWHMLKSSRAQG